VSSVAGLYGYPGLSVYCATKHAMEGAAAVMREELRKFNVPVITVQPGDFSKATNLLANHHRNMNEMWSEMNEYQREEYKDYFVTYHNGVAKSGVTGKRIKPTTVLPESIIRGFEKALLTRSPDEKYLILPTMLSQLKMRLLGMVPESVSQRLVARKYRKGLPKVSPTPLLGSIRSNSSTMSTVSTVNSSRY